MGVNWNYTAKYHSESEDKNKNLNELYPRCQNKGGILLLHDNNRQHVLKL